MKMTEIIYMTEKNNDSLIKSIKQLTEENKKTNSLKNNLFRGIFFGLGSAIGASLIAAVVIGFIAKFFHVIKNFFNIS